MKRRVIMITALMLLLVSCVIPATPTTVPVAPTTTLQPSSLLGTKWKLDRIIVNSETRPDLKKADHDLSFTWDGELWTDDGCHYITVPVTVTAIDRRLEFGSPMTATAQKCLTNDPLTGQKVEAPTDKFYVGALHASNTYDIRDNELWLYFSTSADSGLVFELVDADVQPQGTPQEIIVTRTIGIATQTPRTDTGSLLAIVNGTLIDGTGTDPIKDAVLIIQGERIVAVGARGSIGIPANAQIIDVQGATILPGFFNAHVHGAYNEVRLAAWAKEGVTTVRDLGAHLWPPPKALIDRVEEDNRYARLISGGIFITPLGGYPIAVFGGIGKTISTTEEAPHAVNELLDQGANVIKISLESGQIFGQTVPMLTPEQVLAIVATAHLRGTRVSAHALVSEDLQRAIDGGVDDVAHMVVDHLNDDLIKAMVDRDMVWVPTLELWMNVGTGKGTQAVDNLRRYSAAGGRVALGTDFEGYRAPFELGMPTKEIGWMSEAGMTPMQIIVAATKNAAHVSNVENDLGTLETGKIADVLIVKGDPLRDLKTLSAALYVIHNGEVIRQP
jgi:imidazolonepropionase-like amidohydrolase